MTKFYAVKKGRKTGIFYSWEECQKQIFKFPEASFKSFNTEEDAKNFLLNTETYQTKSDYEIYVDGSYNVVTNEFSYGLIVLHLGEIIYKDSQKHFDEELSNMRNVAGELRGAMKAMQYAVNQKIKEVNLYYDYEGIAKWCLGEWQTKKSATKAYKKFYDEQVKDRVKINFIKVKGHSNNKYNDLVDQLAKDVLGIK